MTPTLRHQERNKRKVSDEIRQRKREEKLQCESTAQDPTVANSLSNSEKDNRMISENSEKPFL
jgi:hypothetical protein